MDSISIGSKELVREIVLRLVWGAGDRSMIGRGLPPKPCASLVKNVEIFPQWRSMILERKVHSPRLDKVEGRTRRG